MKTLSLRFRFVVIGVIAIVAIVSCCTIPNPLIPDTKSVITATVSYIEIGPQPGAKIRGRTYVDWKDKAKFEKALAQVHDNKNRKICICVLESSGGTPYLHPLNNNCPPDYKCPSGKIRTVKVTKSKAAENIAVGESAVNDPNITYRIQSSNAGDIIAVLDALK